MPFSLPNHDDFNLPKIDDAKLPITYDKLSKDKRYKDVEFDPETGALKATHLGHNEGHHPGFVLEKELVGSLYKCGHSIILCDEQKKGSDGNTLVSLDMVLDGVRMDIKSITKKKFLRISH